MTSKLDKSKARRGGTLKELLQLSNIYSIDVCCIKIMVLRNKIMIKVYNCTY